MDENVERLDVVGYWTEMKLAILQEYASAYARVLKDQPMIKHVAYIDGFAGAGAHISKKTGEMIEGSPARALSIEPPFSHYHFIEMDESARIGCGLYRHCGMPRFTMEIATKC